MSLWTEIVNTALIGCEKKTPAITPADNKLGGLLAQIDQKDREGALLSAAALVSHYERAGALPMKDRSPLPEPCEPDAAPRCGDMAAIRLARILGGEYQSLLPEWLEKTAEAGLRAPEELLPPLLEFGRTRNEDFGRVWRALDARGRWLAAQNPHWNYAVGELDESLWETGNSKQRIEVLAKLRNKAPARGREMLEATWAQESPKDRAEFLAALKIGLSLDDEAFLEAALDDRRKEVRREAANLLAELPESALRRRMLDRVRPMLAFKLNKLKRKTIEVTLPKACDKAMQRDGVESTPYSRSVGEKGWWLRQMLGVIPPKVWLEESGWSMSELIEVAKRSDWKSILLDGWSQAAQLCRDLEWAEALLAETYREAQSTHLFEVLPQARRESFIIKVLEKDRSLSTSKPARMYVEICEGPWSEALSRAVIGSLLHHVATDGLNPDWVWTGFVDSVGRHIDPSLIPETISRLTEAAKPPAERSRAVEQFLDFIQFRHEMLKEINQ